MTNAEMTKALGAALHRPTVVPIPSFGPKLLLGGELAEALLFDRPAGRAGALQPPATSSSTPSWPGALRGVARPVTA